MITNNISYTLHEIMFLCDVSGFINVCVNLKHSIDDGITQHILTTMHYLYYLKIVTSVFVFCKYISEQLKQGIYTTQSMPNGLWLELLPYVQEWSWLRDCVNDIPSPMSLSFTFKCNVI
jgi:hypothetical protein